MRSFHLLVLFLLPVLTNGLELAVGTDKGMVILRGSGKDYEEQRLGSNGVSIHTLAVDSAHSRIFFSRTEPLGGVLVEVMPLDSQNSIIQSVIKTSQGPQNVRGLVYHEGTDALYWTDRMKCEISMIRVTEALKDHNATVLHSFKQNEKPAGIAIDVCHGLLFWTNDNHNHPTVERSNLDGSDKLVIAFTNLFMPVAVAVDPVGDGRLFWAENMEGNEYKIEMSHLDGSGRVTLQIGYQRSPFGISYVPSDGHNVQVGLLLWSDTINDVICQMKIPDGVKLPKIESKEIHSFRRATTWWLTARTSLSAGSQTACKVTSVNAAANMTITMQPSIKEGTLSSEALMSKDLRKVEEETLSPLKEPNIWMEATSASSVVVRTELTSLPPQDPTPMTGAPRSSSSDANSVRQFHDYSVKGEPKEKVNGGSVKCRCVHGSCSLEQGSDGQRRPKCVCQKGFVGERCQQIIPCCKYCINGWLCKTISGGEIKCHCLGKGQQLEKEKPCDGIPNLCQDNSEPSVTFVPYEGKDGDVRDTESPHCVCPLSASEHMNTSMNGKANAMGEPSLAVVSPIVLALVGVCVVLLVISLYLTFKVMKLRRLPRIKKRIIVSKGSVPLAAGSGGRGPSGGSPIVGEQQQCEITIENCCNMNVCETPCFEPQLRSPGKSGMSSKTTTKEEKEVLLGDMDGPKTSCGPCPGADELY